MDCNFVFLRNRLSGIPQQTVHKFVVHKLVYQHFFVPSQPNLLIIRYKYGQSVCLWNEISLSLGITPQNYQPEEILQLPEMIAQEQGVHLVVCIDEFQQIGEFNNSLVVQKRLRGVWQHQRNVSYCLFGSKKHLMMKLFQNRRMPFYQFGELRFV